jgi:hypothetical protein
MIISYYFYLSVSSSSAKKLFFHKHKLFIVVGMVLAVSLIDLIYICYTRDIIDVESVNITIYTNQTSNQSITVYSYAYDCKTNIYVDFFCDLQNLAMRDIIPFVFIFIMNIKTVSQLYGSHIETGGVSTQREKKESSFRFIILTSLGLYQE